MRYCISDIHGEYDLFCRLMEYVKFSDSDELFVLGDMTDKGNDTVALCNLLRNVPNIHCILGNHECDFLKAYHGLMKIPTAISTKCRTPCAAISRGTAKI